MDSASDSLEIEGFSVLASHSPSDNGGPQWIGGVRKTDSYLGDRSSDCVSSDGNPTLSPTSIRMNI